MDDHRLVLIVGLATALPVLVSTVRALVAGWNAVFDDAIIATRSYDVFSSHAPLVGEHSDASVSSVGPTFSPGPLLNWLLAIPARLPGNWALPVTIGLLNTVAIVGIIALAHRRGGRPLMLASALAVVVMCHSLPQEVLHAPDNSKAVLIIFMLLLFLAWSVACGDYRLLPVTALVGSLVLQAHLAVALASVGALVVAVVGLALSLARPGRGAPRPGRSATRGRPSRWVLAALAVTFVCWSAPLLDIAIHPPGNLVRIVQTATVDQKTVGLTVGWRALVRTIGIPPWWLRPPTGQATVRLSDLASAPSSASVVSCLAVLLGLVVVALLGVRRRRLAITVPAVLALVLSGAIVPYTASTPVRLGIPLLVYGLRWCSPAGILVWLALGWSVGLLLASTGSTAGWLARMKDGVAARSRLATLTAVGLTAALAILTSAGAGSDAFHWIYRPVRALTPRLAASLPRQSSVLVLAASFPGYTAQEGLIYQLRRAGYHPLAPPADRIQFGAYYNGNRRHDEILFVGDSNTPAPANFHQIASVPIHGVGRSIGQENEPPPTMITVSVLRDFGSATRPFSRRRVAAETGQASSPPILRGQTR